MNTILDHAPSPTTSIILLAAAWVFVLKPFIRQGFRMLVRLVDGPAPRRLTGSGGTNTVDLDHK